MLCCQKHVRQDCWCLHALSGLMRSLWPGSFGTVYKAMMDGSQEVAVKVLKVSQPCADGAAAKRIKVFVNEVLPPSMHAPAASCQSCLHCHSSMAAASCKHTLPGDHMSPPAAGACTTRDGSSPAC